jgi:molecular chaperone GrpE
MSVRDEINDAMITDNATLQAELEKLQKQVEELDAKAKDNMDGWQRERASFANFRKRQESEMKDLRALASQDFIKKLLPIIDDFDRAAKNMPSELKANSWLSGLMLVQRKLSSALESEGIKAIETAPNAPFDPSVQEAVSHDDADGIESGHVIEELQRGYMLGDKVLRPTLVRVAR